MFGIRSNSGEAPTSAGRQAHFAIPRKMKWLLLAAGFLCSAMPARAEYRLHVGDVIEISVARLPELKQRVPVQMDGTISFPLLGTISIADLSPAEVQAKVRATLAGKVFRQKSSDGRENSVGIYPEEVTATV